jgi:hypothetical protein
MTTWSSIKQWLVAGLLLAVTGWPPIQMWLVARYDLSPWKAAGWGMYSAPRPNQLGLEIFGIDGTGQEQRLRQPSTELRTAVGAFLERWRWLGRLADPSELGPLVRRIHPDWGALRIVAYKPVLNRQTGYLEMTETTYRLP